MTFIFRPVLVLFTVSSLCAVALAQSTPAAEQSLHVGGYGSFRFEANDIPDRQFVPGGLHRNSNGRPLLFEGHELSPSPSHLCGRAPELS